MKIVRVLFLVVMFCFPASRVMGFALAGPYESWMTDTNSFGLDGDIAGPMAITNEYRWNVPVVTYAFDDSFLNYFGSNGVAAVEEAIGILNALPNASQVNLDDYPLLSAIQNYTAQDQGLTDLKSATLSHLLQQMGLERPAQAIYCIHDFSGTNGATITNSDDYTLITRNYDPVTLCPSQYVNDSFYVFDIRYIPSKQSAFIYAYPVDPTQPTYTAVADGSSGFFGYQTGLAYIGLTRDDVGGLRYLLSATNFNYETLLPDVHAAGANPGQFVNLAQRAGVGKITFVNGAYSSLLGQFFSPITYQYTDSYLSNGIVVTQQLERAVSKPDILFSAATFDGYTTTISCTGASNWMNNASLNGNSGGAGPGVIQPPIHITFRKTTPTIFQTYDGGGYNVYQDTWGSYDNTTNAPVRYPLNPGNGPLNITLHLQQTNLAPVGNFSGYTWQLPALVGDTVTLQRSSDLKHWSSLGVATYLGVDIDWQHYCLFTNGFFRVISNTH